MQHGKQAQVWTTAPLANLLTIVKIIELKNFVLVI